MSSEAAYRPEIDGLRAVAVVLVVLYHAQLGVPGGFIGVDVFFVISGFLITSIVARDLETGKFSFGQFWERRARRILPALSVTLVTTLVAAGLIFMPDDFKRLGRSAFSQSAFAANFYFWLHSGYFADRAEQQPLLHTWSLAVEEQFYFVLPIVLFYVGRSTVRTSPRLRLLLWGAAAISLALSVALLRIPTQTRAFGALIDPQSASFYLLPTRAWELLMGSILALYPFRRVSNSVHEVISVAGLILILLPAFTYDRTTPFPGLAAVPPCLGTALIIWASTQSSTTTSRALSLPPLTFIGLISYSLYLWHWPLLVLARYWSFGPLSVVQRSLVVAASLLVSFVSWKFVETPFRQRSVCPTRSSILRFAAASILGVLSFGLAVDLLDGVPGRFEKRVIEPYLEVRKNRRKSLVDLTTRDIIEGRLVPVGTATTGPIKLLVWGDSHAGASLPAFRALCNERGIVCRAATHGSLPPVVNFVVPKSLRKEIPKFNDAVIEFVRSRGVKDVFLVAAWGQYQEGRIVGERTQPGSDFEAALLMTVKRLVEVGAQPWIVAQAPDQPFDVPRAIVQAKVFGRDLTPWLAGPEEFDGVSKRKLGPELRALGARVIDTRAAFLTTDREHYRVLDDAGALYSDDNHLSEAGALSILLPLLRTSLIPAE